MTYALLHTYRKYFEGFIIIQHSKYVYDKVVHKI